MPVGSVLVVDDAQTNREVLARRLVQEGYHVLTAASGPEALALVKTHEVKLVLLDLLMPGMSGLEVLRELRKSRDDRALPILMVSAEDDSPQMVEAIDQGANDYLVKPVNFPVLLAKMRRYLNLRASSTTHMDDTMPPPSKAVTPSREPVAPLKLGDTLGHYRLQELLGEGGMGQVYRAQDLRLLRQVAVKVMHQEGLPPDSFDRFMVEAQAVARISHPAVVTIYDIEVSPRPYIAMEFVEGVSLQQRTQGRAPDLPSALAIMVQVLSALAVVHQAGVVHRDLKPSNIMVGEDFKVKVLDFGLAKLEDSEQHLTRTGQMFGTPQYMAPEQIDPDLGCFDARTDLFSAASILYELLAGERAFSGSSVAKLIFDVLSKDPVPPHELNPSVSPELSEVVLKGMRKKKEERYANCGDFLEDLRRFC